MKTRVILAIIYLSLGLIIAAVPAKFTSKQEQTAKSVLQNLVNNNHYIESLELADMLINEQPDVLVIDTRDSIEYLKYSIPSAVNVLHSEILDDKWSELFEDDSKMKIIYSNGTIQANNLWLLLNIKSYQNVFVLRGGINYWISSVLNPTEEGTALSDDEKLRFEFRKGVATVLGGADIKSNTNNKTNIKKKIKTRKRRKPVDGGC